MQRERQAQIAAEEAALRRASHRKRVIIRIIVLIALAVAAYFTVTSIQKSNKYNHAAALMNMGRFDEARTTLTELGDYKDCFLLLKQVMPISSGRKTATQLLMTFIPPSRQPIRRMLWIIKNTTMRLTPLKKRGTMKGPAVSLVSSENIKILQPVLTPLSSCAKKHWLSTTNQPVNMGKRGIST